MEKMVRCTVCVWRGTRAEAYAAPRVRQPSIIPPAEINVQVCYEEERLERLRLGHSAPPPCPECGHHLVAVERRSVRPAA